VTIRSAKCRDDIWVVNYGTSNRGNKAAGRQRERRPKLALVQVPVHANCIGQVEIYFSAI